MHVHVANAFARIRLIDGMYVRSYSTYQLPKISSSLSTYFSDGMSDGICHGISVKNMKVARLSPICPDVYVATSRIFLLNLFHIFSRL